MPPRLVQGEGMGDYEQRSKWGCRGYERLRAKIIRRGIQVWSAGATRYIWSVKLYKNSKAEAVRGDGVRELVREEYTEYGKSVYKHMVEESGARSWGATRALNARQIGA